MLFRIVFVLGLLILLSGCQGVEVTPSEGGVVKGLIHGVEYINCGIPSAGNCGLERPFAQETVEFVAEALPGYEFKGWGGVCAQSTWPGVSIEGGLCRIGIGESNGVELIVSALFEREPAVLEVKPAPGGRVVSLNRSAELDLDCGGSEQVDHRCERTYAREGDQSPLVKVLALADEGYRFEGWRVCPGVSLGNSCELLMSASQEVEAIFVALSEPVTLSPDWRVHVRRYPLAEGAVTERSDYRYLNSGLSLSEVECTGHLIHPSWVLIAMACSPESGSDDLVEIQLSRWGDWNRLGYFRFAQGALPGSFEETLAEYGTAGKRELLQEWLSVPEQRLLSSSKYVLVELPEAYQGYRLFELSETELLGDDLGTIYQHIPELSYRYYVSYQNLLNSGSDVERFGQSVWLLLDRLQASYVSTDEQGFEIRSSVLRLQALLQAWQESALSEREAVRVTEALSDLMLKLADSRAALDARAESLKRGDSASGLEFIEYFVGDFLSLSLPTLEITQTGAESSGRYRDLSSRRRVEIRGRSLGLSPGSAVELRLTDVHGQAQSFKSELDAEGQWRVGPLDLSGALPGELRLQAYAQGLGVEHRSRPVVVFLEEDELILPGLVESEDFAYPVVRLIDLSESEPDLGEPLDLSEYHALERGLPEYSVSSPEGLHAQVEPSTEWHTLESVLLSLVMHADASQLDAVIHALGEVESWPSWLSLWYALVETRVWLQSEGVWVGEGELYHLSDRVLSQLRQWWLELHVKGWLTGSVLSEHYRVAESLSSLLVELIYSYGVVYAPLDEVAMARVSTGVAQGLERLADFQESVTGVRSTQSLSALSDWIDRLSASSSSDAIGRAERAELSALLPRGEALLGQLLHDQDQLSQLETAYEVERVLYLLDEWLEDAMDALSSVSSPLSIVANTRLSKSDALWFLFKVSEGLDPWLCHSYLEEESGELCLESWDESRIDKIKVQAEAVPRVLFETPGWRRLHARVRDEKRQRPRLSREAQVFQRLSAEGLRARGKVLVSSHAAECGEALEYLNWAQGQDRLKHAEMAKLEKYLKWVNPESIYFDWEVNQRYALQQDPSVILWQRFSDALESQLGVRALSEVVWPEGASAVPPGMLAALNVLWPERKVRQQPNLFQRCVARKEWQWLTEAEQSASSTPSRERVQSEVSQGLLNATAIYLQTHWLNDEYPLPSQRVVDVLTQKTSDDGGDDIEHRPLDQLLRQVEGCYRGHLAEGLISLEGCIGQWIDQRSSQHRDWKTELIQLSAADRLGATRDQLVQSISRRWRFDASLVDMCLLADFSRNTEARVGRFNGLVNDVDQCYQDSQSLGPVVSLNGETPLAQCAQEVVSVLSGAADRDSLASCALSYHLRGHLSRQWFAGSYMGQQCLEKHWRHSSDSWYAHESGWHRSLQEIEQCSEVGGDLAGCVADEADYWRLSDGADKAVEVCAKWSPLNREYSQAHGSVRQSQERINAACSALSSEYARGIKTAEYELNESACQRCGAKMEYVWQGVEHVIPGGVSRTGDEGEARILWESAALSADYSAVVAQGSPYLECVLQAQQRGLRSRTGVSENLSSHSSLADVLHTHAAEGDLVSISQLQDRVILNYQVHPGIPLYSSDESLDLSCVHRLQGYQAVLETTRGCIESRGSGEHSGYACAESSLRQHLHRWFLDKEADKTRSLKDSLQSCGEGKTADRVLSASVLKPLTSMLKAVSPSELGHREGLAYSQTCRELLKSGELKVELEHTEQGLKLCAHKAGESKQLCLQRRLEASPLLSQMVLKRSSASMALTAPDDLRGRSAGLDAVLSASPFSVEAQASGDRELKRLPSHSEQDPYVLSAWVESARSWGFWHRDLIHLGVVLHIPDAVNPEHVLERGLLCGESEWEGYGSWAAYEAQVWREYQSWLRQAQARARLALERHALTSGRQGLEFEHVHWEGVSNDWLPYLVVRYQINYHGVDHNIAAQQVLGQRLARAEALRGSLQAWLSNLDGETQKSNPGDAYSASVRLFERAWVANDLQSHYRGLAADWPELEVLESSVFKAGRVGLGFREHWSEEADYDVKTTEIYAGGQSTTYLFDRYSPKTYLQRFQRPRQGSVRLETEGQVKHSLAALDRALGEHIEDLTFYGAGPEMRGLVNRVWFELLSRDRSESLRQVAGILPSLGVMPLVLGVDGLESALGELDRYVLSEDLTADVAESGYADVAQALTSRGDLSTIPGRLTHNEYQQILALSAEVSLAQASGSRQYAQTVYTNWCGFSSNQALPASKLQTLEDDDEDEVLRKEFLNLHNALASFGCRGTPVAAVGYPGPEAMTTADAALEDNHQGGAYGGVDGARHPRPFVKKGLLLNLGVFDLVTHAIQDEVGANFSEVDTLYHWLEAAMDRYRQSYSYGDFTQVLEYASFLAGSMINQTVVPSSDFDQIKYIFLALQAVLNRTNNEADEDDRSVFAFLHPLTHGVGMRVPVALSTVEKKIWMALSHVYLEWMGFRDMARYTTHGTEFYMERGEYPDTGTIEAQVAFYKAFVDRVLDATVSADNSGSRRSDAIDMIGFDLNNRVRFIIDSDQLSVLIHRLEELGYVNRHCDLGAIALTEGQLENLDHSQDVGLNSSQVSDLSNQLEELSSVLELLRNMQIQDMPANVADKIKATIEMANGTLIRLGKINTELKRISSMTVNIGNFCTSTVQMGHDYATLVKQALEVLNEVSQYFNETVNDLRVQIAVISVTHQKLANNLSNFLKTLEHTYTSVRVSFSHAHSLMDFMCGCVFSCTPFLSRRAFVKACLDSL